MIMARRVPFTGDEKESLHVALDRHRDAVLWKLEGLDEEDEDADLRVDPDETAEGILAFYGRARAAADQVIGELGMDDTGTAWFGDAVSLRWVLIHMVEETARHAGHIDILRELTDGMAGDHRGQ
jgi:hypothetical protein